MSWNRFDKGRTTEEQKGFGFDAETIYHTPPNRKLRTIQDVEILWGPNAFLTTTVRGEVAICEIVKTSLFA